MKHYLNFKPSIVFRKGSSFMLKTCLIILYGLPLALVFFWSYSYFSINALNEFYSENYQLLDRKNSEFSAHLKSIKPDIEDLQEREENYFAYRKVSQAFKTSWSVLFETLEGITPGDVVFNRIRIRPDKLVKVVIEGEAEKLSSMTAFLQKLYNDKNFLNPMLKRHTRPDESNEKVAFSLEVDYLGKRGELP